MLNIDIIQQVIYSLALALFFVVLSRLPRLSLFFSSLLFALVVLGENLIPIWRGSSLVELARGVIGDLSTASGMLLFLIILNQFDFSDNPKSVLNWPERIGLIIVGLLLYLATFGFISFDIYHLGYLSRGMLFSISIGALAMVIYDRRLGYVWLVALISFYFRLQPSNNLWDYLYDPVLWIVLLINAINALFELNRSKPKDAWLENL